VIQKKKKERDAIIQQKKQGRFARKELIMDILNNRQAITTKDNDGKI